VVAVGDPALLALPDLDEFLKELGGRVRVVLMDRTATCTEVTPLTDLTAAVDAEIARLIDPAERCDSNGLHTALRASGVPLEEAALIDSTPDGIDAAVGAGVGLVVGLDLHGQAGAMLQHGADVVISRLTEFELDVDGTWRLQDGV
jgi:beta-phosphoglucomutase-like phosphatase (HAD superfamily)